MEPDPGLGPNPPSHTPPKCDCCTINTAVLYCAADSATLCLICDRKVHSANALSLKHVRNPTCWPGSNDGFSGCPAVAELARLLGIADLVGPGSDPGRVDEEVYGQLVRLGRWDLEERENVEFGPGTPSLCGNVDGLELDMDRGGGSGGSDIRPDLSLTSLLMMNNGDGGGEGGKSNFVNDGGQLLWDFDPAYQTADQVWDCPWGRSLDVEESSCASTRMSEDVCEMECSGLIKTTQSINDCRNQMLDDQYFATAENCAVPIVGLSSEPNVIKPETFDGEHQFQVMEWPYWRQPMSKADMEQLAENRGKAMLRYKEKKKMRRYDKHVRYESRKARADTRKRVKGRFVKASDTPNIEIHS